MAGYCIHSPPCMQLVQTAVCESGLDQRAAELAAFVGRATRSLLLTHTYGSLFRLDGSGDVRGP
eukprot:5020700-Prymnesium_polylepis.1